MVVVGGEVNFMGADQSEVDMLKSFTFQKIQSMMKIFMLSELFSLQV